MLRVLSSTYRAIFTGRAPHLMRAGALAVMCALFVPHVAQASDSGTAKITTRALHQALSAQEKIRLFGDGKNGFGLTGAYFTGYASGISPSGNLGDFTLDQKLYALLIDGRYDFAYETSSLSEPLRPYISGGAGFASLGGNNASPSLQIDGGTTVPLLRFGGGVAYRLGEQWNLSLDYNAGYAPISTGDQMFTGRGQQPVNLQSLNLGMRLNF